MYLLSDVNNLVKIFGCICAFFILILSVKKTDN